MDLDLFTTVSLIEAVEQRYAVPSFLRDTFFGDKEYSDADAVLVDTYRGGKGLAPFVLPLEGQVVGRRLPFGRTYVEAPIIAPARVISLRDIGRPGMGENAYNYKSPEERFATIIARDTKDMDDEISRTEEYMCGGCMFGGKINVNYRNKTNIVIDYGFTNTVALAKPWTDVTSDPFADLRAAQSSLNANGFSGNVAVYSPNAWTALMGNPNVKDALKATIGLTPITNIAMGEATPAGVVRGPDFVNPPLQNWIYSATYQKAGVAVPYVPPGQVLIGSSNIKNRLIYAIVSQIEQEDGSFHSYMLDRVPKREVNVNKNFFMLTISSRPVPVPVDLLSWAVLTGAA